MIIGLTYDLKDDYIARGFSAEHAAEFDSIETIEALESAIHANGHEMVRIGNIHDLVTALAAGQSWDLVFNICEGVSGISRESQVPALLEAYDIPYTFSAPEVLSITMDKSLAKTVVRDVGIPTAPWKVIRTPDDLEHASLTYPLFLKPLAEGSSKGISEHSFVQNIEDAKKEAAFFLSRFSQPVLAESYLPGREFTVGILGEGANASVIAVMEVNLDNQPDTFARSLANKDVDWTMPELFKLAYDPQAVRAGEIALASWKTIRGRDAGRVDLRCDANGVPNFMEVNPLPGLRPIYSDLPILSELAGIPHSDLIGHIITNAMRRYGLHHTPLKKKA